MTLLVGIDEAGYGPNLGPFVMTAASCRVPSTLTSADLWQVLRPCLRRHTEPDDGRLLVDDSKQVYLNGLAALELGALALAGGSAPNLADLLAALGPHAPTGLTGEAWYDGGTALPVAAATARCRAWADRLAGHEQVAWQRPRSVLVGTAQFNEITERHSSKGAVLSHCLGLLLRQFLDDTNPEPLVIHIDKHGGRNFYGSMVQDLLETGMVLAGEEGPLRSAYSIVGLARPVTLTFQPRADGEHVAVALASMVSKYVRELLMLEFNRFWERHVPGLKPTAGYPTDARRYYQAILPVARQLGIPESALWRCK